MKSLSSAMIGYLHSDTQTFNTCWKITRLDGTIYRFTDCDQPIVVPADGTYESVDSYTPSNAQSSSTLDVDHVEVAMAFATSAITEADLMAGKFDDATVSMFLVNRNDLSAGVYHIRDGVIGQVTVTSPGMVQVELRGLTQYLQKNIGKVISPTCRWDLGSNSLTPAIGQPWGLCTVNLAALAVTGVAVTSVSTNQTFTASSLGQAAGYFQAGSLTWTSGNNNGRSMDVQAFGLGGGIVLQLPMLNTVQVGDLFTIYPGCQKRFTEDCVTKFSNGINFGGFKDLPGLDKLIRPGGV